MKRTANTFSMLRLIKFGWLAALLLGFQSAFGFALLGPINEPYQVVLLGYALSPVDKIFGNGGADIGAPKNIGEGYRRATPVMYYAADANFLTYFGSNGLYAVDRAYAILNALPKASDMSPDLSEWPLEAERLNPTAEALQILDLKSQTLALMMENLGLAEPERYIWAMHDRYLPSGGACPVDEEYLIVKRNFDPVTYLPSSYVNGTLYTYVIDELCAATPPPNWRALCQPIAVDGDANTFTAIASDALLFGQLYTGLTRDDVGGIRYLLSSNNVATELAPTNSTTITTNMTQAVVVYTSNLTQLAEQALYTNAISLEALYPGLVVTSSTNYPVIVWTTNLTFLYFTNKPWDPVGTPPYIPVFATNRAPVVQLRYHHTFANIVTFSNTPNGWVTVPIISLDPFFGREFVDLETTTATSSPWGSSGGGTNSTGSTLVTNTTSHFYLTNQVVGDFAILPTNTCGLLVGGSILTNIYTITNLLTSTNNLAGSTTNNAAGSTNATPFYSQSLVEYLTNRIFWVFTADCGSNVAVLRQGVEKITFYRRDFDSLLSRLFVPITNQYQVQMVTNYTLVTQTIERIVTAPDFLFTAADLDSGPAGIPYTPAEARNIQFTTSPGYPGEAGPGTIEPGTVFTFNKGTPVYFNLGGGTATELSQLLETAWGSFDMSTNMPIVYPSSASLTDLENMVLIQVMPFYLPDGSVGSPYSVQFQTQGSTPNWVGPYTWSLAPNSDALPPGVDLWSTGLLTGVPAQAGTYYFVVRVTDQQGRNIDRSYSIQVN